MYCTKIAKHENHGHEYDRQRNLHETNSIPTPLLSPLSSTLTLHERRTQQPPSPNVSSVFFCYAAFFRFYAVCFSSFSSFETSPRNWRRLHAQRLIWPFRQQWDLAPCDVVAFGKNRETSTCGQRGSTVGDAHPVEQITITTTKTSLRTISP